MKERRTWENAKPMSEQGKNAVRFNGTTTGQKAAPILAIKRLLHQTVKLLKTLY